MRTLVPLTKIIIVLATAVWAIALTLPENLLILCLVELLLLSVSKELYNNMKAVIALVVFAGLLGLLEYIGGGTYEMSQVAALRMLGMTLVFIYLLATVRLQDLTAAMVCQLKISYEYAFMFTSGLRFIPDFMEENKAVSEAQACRGLDLGGGFIRQTKRYLSVVRPLMLRSLGRSETMALSLELRGFGGDKRTFMESVALRGKDYIVIAITVFITVFVLYGRVKCGF